MATLYPRKGRWWVSWYVNGGRRQESTGYRLDEREAALKVKEDLERELEARKRVELPPEADNTFRAYRKEWMKRRHLQGLSSAKDDEARLKHARELDELGMAQVKPRHIRDLVLSLRARTPAMAPRTIRHVFSVLHRLFEDALIEERVLANPCTVSKGVLPGKVDKDPTWRSGAVFSRDEAERLLVDELVPEQRRAFYAALFLAGVRFGEAAALRWQHYDATLRPLGRLLVAKSYNRKLKREKGLKVEGSTREVPVHPALAAALAAWKLGGWERLIGRAPRPDDLMFPATTGRNQSDDVAHANMLRDLANLGMRPRRTHDTRRTFISLALADGARKDVLKWVTHGPPDDIISLYTTLPWEALCAEVSRLNIRLRSPATPQLHPTTSSGKD